MEKYYEMFEEELKFYIEFRNDGCLEEEKIELSKDEIDEIIERLIRKQEYMWEIIHDCMDVEIERVCEKRSND